MKIRAGDKVSIKNPSKYVKKSLEKRGFVKVVKVVDGHVYVDAPVSKTWSKRQLVCARIEDIEPLTPIQIAKMRIVNA